jgi:hypothetical protein
MHVHDRLADLRNIYEEKTGIQLEINVGFSITFESENSQFKLNIFLPIADSHKFDQC